MVPVAVGHVVAAAHMRVVVEPIDLGNLHALAPAPLALERKQFVESVAEAVAAVAVVVAVVALQPYAFDYALDLLDYSEHWPHYSDYCSHTNCCWAQMQ